MTVSPSPTTQTSAAAAAERIAAIKRDVNAAVGNPVNLIDVNNTVGREYMNALLDAMKKATGAASGQEIERAMARLERAYEAVRGIVTISSTAASLPVVNAAEISAGASQLPSSALPPKETDVPTQPPVAPHNPPMEEVIEIRPKHMADGAAEVVSTPEPMPVQASESLPIEELVPEVVVPKRRQLSVQSADEVLEGGETPLSVPVQSGVQRTPVIEEVQQVPSAPEVVPVIAAIEVEAPRVPEEPVRQARSEELPTEQDASPRADRITSVAKEQQLAELMEARKAAELATDEAKSMRAAQDPLMADEVTQGLHQLLSEWKLFKSSGIFGTGPSGFDHPLYKKLSELTMASLLAGRFEGATAEIKRSISDYMNGWRYEEGVLHEPGETFEMYLRRVIRRILDNQVKK
jgi:hypothetical protein